MRKLWTNRAFLFLLVIVMIVPLFVQNRCYSETGNRGPPEKPDSAKRMKT